MKNFKKIVAIIAALFMIATIISGCGQKAAEQTTAAETTQAVQSEQTTVSASAQETTASNFPLTVKDAGGTEVVIEKAPEKIVSLTLGSDEMLLGLIDKARIIAATPYSVDAGVSNVADQAKDIPNIVTSADAEKIIALQPDLLIIDTWANADFVKQMRDAKITVYIFQTPSNIDAQKKTIIELAHVVGADQKGAEIVAWMDETLNKVEDKLKDIKEDQKLSILDYSEMGSTSGKGTNTDDILTKAGLVNVVSRAGLDGWPTVNKENIVEWNPDLILLPSWYYDAKLSLDGMKKMLKDDKSLADVKAIKADKFITVPYQHMSAISQYVVLAVEDVAKAAYPELFK